MKQQYTIFFTLFSAYFGLAMVNPLIGPVMRKLHFHEMHISMVFAIAAVSLFAASPLWGRSCEKIGRRTVLLVGIFNFSLAYIFFALCIQLGLSGLISLPLLFLFLLLIRFYGGVIFGAVLTGTQAMMADLTQGKKRASGMALLGAANGLGMILGPAVGSMMVGVAWAAPVYLAAVFPLIMGWVLIKYIPKERPRNRVCQKQPYISPFDRRIFPYLLTGIIVHFAVVILQVTSGLYLEDQLGLNTEAAAQSVSLAMFVMGTVAFLGQMTVRKLSPSFVWLLRLGSPLLFLGFFSFINSPSLFGIIISFAVIGLGISLLIPGYLTASSLSVGEDLQGAVAGLNGAANGLGAMVAPLVGSFLYGIHPVWPYELCLLFIFAITVLAYVIRPDTKEHTEPSTF